MSTHKLTEEQKARKRLRDKERRERMKAEKARKAEPAKKGAGNGTTGNEADDIAAEIEKLGGVEILDRVVLGYSGARLYRAVCKSMHRAVANAMERYIDATGFVVSANEKNAEIATNFASEALTSAVKDFAANFKVESIKACLRRDGK